MDIHARLRFARIAPRKMRLVAKTLSGLSVSTAESHLRYLAPRSAGVLLKVLQSAIANAKENFDLDPKNLIIRSVIVNEGVKLKRFMPRARGSAYRIEKKTSHVDLVLTERTPTAGPRKGKTSEFVTRTIEEVSREDLSGHTHDHDHDHEHDEKETGSHGRAVRGKDQRGGKQLAANEERSA